MALTIRTTSAFERDARRALKRGKDLDKREFEYNEGMELQVDAVYENGVLRPLEPLHLSEHERVRVSVVTSEAGTGRSQLDVAYIERLRKELAGTEGTSSLDDVRARLAKIPGSMADEIIAERGER
jgi:predicted DNA-binding antitoxin AbrB/MazE fold protein